MIKDGRRYSVVTPLFLLAFSLGIRPLHYAECNYAEYNCAECTGEVGKKLIDSFSTPVLDSMSLDMEHPLVHFSPAMWLDI